MRILAFLMVSIFCATHYSYAQPAALRQKHFNLKNGVAIAGYDPVSYFKGKPKAGSSKLAVNADGVTYYFSSVENLAIFKTQPASYAPQYGGWCAYAMGANGEKVEVDPETYKIIDGHLYLFYNKYFNNTLKSWNKNEAKLRGAANANWNRIYHF